MKKLRQMRIRITEYFFDSSIYIKDRTFVLFTICMVGALLSFTVIRVFFDHSFMALLIAMAAFLVSFGVI